MWTCTNQWLLVLTTSEVYSARERNGIYIPRDRYFEEEAEKKVLSFTKATNS